jgi:hypothetical protein
MKSYLLKKCVKQSLFSILVLSIDFWTFSITNVAFDSATGLYIVKCDIRYYLYYSLFFIGNFTSNILVILFNKPNMVVIQVCFTQT